MSAEEVWHRKSDEELRAAAQGLEEYTEEGPSASCRRCRTSRNRIAGRARIRSPQCRRRGDVQNAQNRRTPKEDPHDASVHTSAA